MAYQQLGSYKNGPGSDAGYLGALNAAGSDAGYLGDVQAAGQAYTDWVAQVKQLGGVATTWPFHDDAGAGDTFGQPAGRWDVATYQSLASAGYLDSNSAEATPTGEYVYVLSSQEVANAAPGTMSKYGVDAYVNSMGTTDGNAADALGLPSFDKIGKVIRTYGKRVAVGGAVAVGVYALAKAYEISR